MHKALSREHGMKLGQRRFYSSADVVLQVADYLVYSGGVTVKCLPKQRGLGGHGIPDADQKTGQASWS